jgi:hypothetical protein
MRPPYTGKRAWKATGDRFKDHATSAGKIMIGKLREGHKEQMLGNIVL